MDLIVVSLVKDMFGAGTDLSNGFHGDRRRRRTAIRRRIHRVRHPTGPAGSRGPAGPARVTPGPTGQGPSATSGQLGNWRAP
jgi:hypothetical protein